MVHAKILLPNPNPVMVEFGEVGEVIVPLPEIKVHEPVPTAAKFPFMLVVGEEIQSV